MAGKAVLDLPKPPPTKGKGNPSAETLAYWDGYFKKRPIEPFVFKLMAEDLKKKKRFQDLEAAVIGYLKHLPRGVEPDFSSYGTLALAIKVNGGDPARFRESMGYAAILAESGGNVNFILTIADLLFLNGDYRYTLKVGGKDREISVGRMIDAVAKKTPHRPQPILMSMNLARKTRDPKRMADAVEAAMSLGWPGMDPMIRAEARRQAEDLADVLKEEGRDSEADDLLARLPSASARDLVIRLTWTGDADLDLSVRESLGATARHDMARSVFGGAIIQDGKGKTAEEIYSCPRGFDGDYTVRVEVVYQDPEKPPITSATLEIITHEGTRDEHRETRSIAIPKPATITVRDKNGETMNLTSDKPLISVPVVVNLKGGRRKEVLPYITPAVEFQAAEEAPAPGREAAKPAPAARTDAEPKPATPPTARPKAANATPSRPQSSSKPSPRTTIQP